MHISPLCLQLWHLLNSLASYTSVLNRFRSQVWPEQRALTRVLLLLVWGLLCHSRLFHYYRDVTITGDGLQILTYARHSWPLSSEVSLACHTYCDTGHPLIMVISEDPWHTYCRAFSSGAVLPVLRLRDSNTKPSACGASTLTHCATAAVRWT